MKDSIHFRRINDLVIECGQHSFKKKLFIGFFFTHSYLQRNDNNLNFSSGIFVQFTFKNKNMYEY